MALLKSAPLKSIEVNELHPKNMPYKSSTLWEIKSTLIDFNEIQPENIAFILVTYFILSLFNNGVVKFVHWLNKNSIFVTEEVSILLKSKFCNE